MNGFFIYRTGNNIWQDTIYTHTLKTSDNIILVNIDEQSINSLQANGDLKMLTIPKKIYANLVDKIEGAGVKGIGFDIIFQNSDPDQNEFAKTLKKYKNIVIGASYYSANEDQNKTCITDETSGGITCKGFPQVTYVSVPWGLVDVGMPNSRNILTENAGAFSRITKFDIYTKNNLGGTETIAGSWKNNLGLDTTLYSLGTEMLRLQDKNLLKRNEFRNNSLLNPYFGGPKSYKSISFIDVINMTNMSELEKIFKGKYVLIGESGTFIHDTITSPVTGTAMDGVELHAHFLDGLIQDKMLTKAPPIDIWIISAFLTIITILFYFYLPNYLSPVFAILVMTGIIWISRYIYDIHRTLMDIFPLLLSVCIATFPMTFIYRFFVVDNEKRYIENAFGHYIDPKMVQMIDMEEVSVSLGGEQRDLSVFFSDIAGFTTISEKLSPKDLFWLMSLYLSRMTEILKKEGGTLDKYIGDAVMGFFGAPIAQSDHAIRACRTAVEMRRILPELNKEITAKGIQAVSFRVGIASGDVMVGNIGSTDHFNYTVLGDTVNLASRLEATGKEYNMFVIISEGTRKQIGDLFALRELDTIAVKGKTEGIRIFELLGFKGDVGDRTMYDTYEKALALYREGKYIEAGKIWEGQMDKDPVSTVMALRCVEIIKGNILVENGVYHMTHK
ncbi:adenylate/guanylate cyclase domain-containing protein [Candidatus Gracilibacteria bacterium]|nr:adenylate/guanylate cyclase domain-containing protein [Candidatus Gracilibacteria bacterium]